MAASHGTSGWIRARDLPGHLLAPLDGMPLRAGLRLAVQVGPRNRIGATHYRIRLDDGSGTLSAPCLQGLCNRHLYPAANWVEVVETRHRLTWPDHADVVISDAEEAHLIDALGALVPPGGHLMIEYESPAHAETAAALAVRVPPVATPLGLLMLHAGCGVAFRDWYIAEGGREGPRKLQGFRALNLDHARRRTREALDLLARFRAGAAGLEGPLWERARRGAEAAEARLRGLPGTLPGWVGDADGLSAGKRLPQSAERDT